MFNSRVLAQFRETLCRDFTCELEGGVRGGGGSSVLTLYNYRDPIMLQTLNPLP